ncbi:MAG: multidrug effflux MFS transporter [Ktedonobacteraceae bacterium]
MSRQPSVAPLLIGTFMQRMNSGAGTVIYGLLLVQISAHTKYAITSLQVGLLPVVFYISELSLAPLMGSLSDHFGRHRFLVLGPLIGLLQVVLLIFTPTKNALFYLLLLQVLAGISSAITTPVVLGYLADFTAIDQSRRMRVMSFYELVTSGGIAVGTVVGGIVWDHFERNAYILLAALYFIVAVCMFLAPVVNQIVDRRRLAVLTQHYWHILSTPRLFIFMPAWICISALVGVWFGSQLTFILSSPVHKAHQVLMGSTSGPGGGHRLSLILGGYVLYFGLCLLFWAFFLNRVPRLRLMLTSIAGVFLACIALGGINHRSDDSLLFLWIILLMLGVFAETSFAPAALAYLADISEEAAKDRGLLMGLYSIFLGLGQIIGGGFGGIFARAFGFDGLIYLTVLLACVALLSLLWLARYERKSASAYLAES